MGIFKNFIVVVILVGIITRVFNHICSKYLKDEKTVIYVSSISSAILTCSLAGFFVGFDVVIAIYLISFIIWYTFDVIRLGAKA
jgi:hypothetical protein